MTHIIDESRIEQMTTMVGLGSSVELNGDRIC